MRGLPLRNSFIVVFMDLCPLIFALFPVYVTPCP